MSRLRPKVTLIVYDLAKNCFGRAYLLGRMLEPEFDVEVAGFASGPTWSPCSDHGWLEVSVAWDDVKNYRGAVSAIAEKSGGDIIIGCKAWPSVLDIGDEISRRRRVTRILDIDDWELGWSYPLRLRKLLSLVRKSRNNPNGFVRVWWAERRARSWPVRLASSRFLQRRFGGVYFPHACDTGLLNPDILPGRSEARARLGLRQDCVWAGFVGSSKPHKGTDVMGQAVAMLDDKNVRMLIAGAETGDPGLSSLKSMLGERLAVLPVFPKSELGDVLAALDMVVLPQRNTPACQAQIPAKVFDALAMKIPVIASGISDLPEVLSGCGVIVRPDDAGALAEAIGGLADNPEERERLGAAGREKCIAEYSFAKLGERLRELVRGGTKGR